MTPIATTSTSGSGPRASTSTPSSSRSIAGTSAGTEPFGSRSTVGASPTATATVPGSRTGAANSTVQRKAVPAGAPTSARAREAQYIPCAIAPFIPSARAAGPERWMGFQSPLTAA